jgi:hypothetical protein
MRMKGEVMDAQPATQSTDELQEPESAPIPPPADNGVEYLESLGPFVDRLMGDGRAQSNADEEISKLVGETPAPEEPEPIEPPPPVEEDNGVLTRGADPDDRGTRRGG